MCGIAGEFRVDGATPEASTVQAMVRTLTHRGPDDEGFYEDGPLAFGMRRLSIVGVDNGHQPLVSDDGNLVLVFNGEIYNYPALKTELEGRGHTFRTASDGEVMLALYREKGPDFLEPLNGMFAVALYDRQARRLLLARDRIGIKPLFVHVTAKRVLFGSEIKALLAHPSCPGELSMDGLTHYLRYSYAPLDATVYQHIRRLLPGEQLVVEEGKTTRSRYWWLPTTAADPADIPKPEHAAAWLRERLDASVRLQLLSDVPVGAFLSGGIDSSAVVALMRPHVDRLTTFCLGFTGDVGGLDERARARETAAHLETEHIDIELDPAEIPQHFDEALRHFDEPFGGGLHTYFLSREAAKTHKVVLTGIGADELLGGYNRNLRLAKTAWVAGLPPVLRRSLSRMAGTTGDLTHHRDDKFRRLERLFLAPPGEQYFAWISLFTKRELEDLLQPAHRQPLMPTPLAARTEKLFSGEAPATVAQRVAWLELRTTLVEDFLAYTDRTTMAHSLEARVPFLDHTLVSAISAWPESLRFTARPKQFLYDAVADLLPATFGQRKKQPFLLPVSRWLRGPLKPFLEETLLDGQLAAGELLNDAAVRHLVHRFLAGEERGWQVWHLMGVERFIRLRHSQRGAEAAGHG